jgi:hypothetical protein
MVAEARAQVDGAIWAKAWAAGRAMPLEQALTEAISEERAVG